MMYSSLSLDRPPLMTHHILSAHWNGLVSQKWTIVLLACIFANTIAFDWYASDIVCRMWYVCCLTDTNTLLSNRLDYCNSLLYGIVQISSIYSQCSTASSLHWFPLRFRIMFKINLLTYKPLREKQCVYLQCMLAASLPSRSLRSNKDNSLSVPRVKTNTGARAFHSCAPSLGSNLPLSVRSAISVATFKKHLKTHLLDLAFPP